MSPDNFTIQEALIPVSSKHTLYAQEWGNPDAENCFIFLHGGPGSGCSDSAKLLFNPCLQRVIFFDQRGSGKSLPTGSLQQNTTSQLVGDISRVADFFGIQSFILVGGSWGSTLALCYALAQPKRVIAMVLRGIFLGTKSEIDFIEQGRFGEFFPDIWDAFLQQTPENFHGNPAAYHVPRILGQNKLAQKQSAFVYAQLQTALSQLQQPVLPVDFASFDVHKIVIETHYTANCCFIENNYILRNASKLTMPIAIVQGRYDFVCPPVTAQLLASELRNATLEFTTAGHSGTDSGNLIAVKEQIESEFWNT